MIDDVKIENHILVNINHYCNRIEKLGNFTILYKTDKSTDIGTCLEISIYHNKKLVIHRYDKLTHIYNFVMGFCRALDANREIG